MRYILFIAAFLMSSLAYGQGTWNKSSTNNAWNRTKVDSVAIVPRDTSATNNAILPSTGQPVGDYGRISVKNKAFYVHDSVRNRKVAYSDSIAIRSNDTLFIGSDTVDSRGYRFLWPLKNIIYAFGDSQTQGGNAVGPPYSDGTLLYPQYRWVNILANGWDRSLTINNFALGSTGISWMDDYVKMQSSFNRLGNIPGTWSGVTVAMNAYGNLDSSTSSPSYFNILEKANQAFIARTLLDNWAGISLNGWDSSGVAGVNNWSTDGSSGGIGPLAMGVKNFFPFYYGNPTENVRWWTELSSGDQLAFTLKDKRAIALFYETSSTGGEFDVLINGFKVASANSQHTNGGGNDYGFFPGVVWLENVPDSARVTMLSNHGATTIRFLAYGWVNRGDSSAVKNKTIIYGTPSGNVRRTTTEAMYAASKAAERAVASFGAYPVFLADVYGQWIQQEGSEPVDPDHLTVKGNEYVARAFNTAYKVSGNITTNFVDLIPNLDQVAKRGSQTSMPINAQGFGSQRLTEVGGSSHFAYYNGDSGPDKIRWGSGLVELETGLNSGSDLLLSRYADDGTYLGSYLRVNRSSGVANFEAMPLVGGVAINADDVNAIANQSSITQTGNFKISGNGIMNIGNFGGDNNVSGDKLVQIRYNTTDDGGVIEAFHVGTNIKPIFINPSGGNIAIGASTATSKLDVNGVNGYSQFRLRTQYTPTSSADTNGAVGDIAVDDNYMYYKTTTGWKRAALSAW